MSDAELRALIAKYEHLSTPQYEREQVRREICCRTPALLDRLAAAEADVARLRSVIEWALGERGTFPDWPAAVTITGNPKYWWRKELRERYAAAREAGK